MDKIELKEMKQLSTKELLIEMINYQSPLDNLTEEYPDDIDNWKMKWEFIEFGTQTVYRYWEKYISIEDLEEEYSDFILNGYLQIYKDEEL